MFFKKLGNLKFKFRLKEPFWNFPWVFLLDKYSSPKFCFHHLAPCNALGLNWWMESLNTKSLNTKGWILADEMIFISVSKQRTLPPWTQVVNWMHIRSLEDVLDVFSTSYMRSIYALCSGGSCVHSSYFSFLYDLIFGCKHDSINFTIESIRSFFNWFIDSTAELNIFSPTSSMLASSSIFTFSSCCKVKKY